jgi:hypothetical protein
MLNDIEKKQPPDPELQALKSRLEEWAEWYSGGQAYGLGYASQALMYQATSSRGAQAMAYLPSHADAEEVESWVREMARTYPLMACVLRQYYFHSGSLRSHARGLNISHVHVKRLVQDAHQWLLRRAKNDV